MVITKLLIYPLAALVGGAIGLILAELIHNRPRCVPPCPKPVVRGFHPSTF